MLDSNFDYSESGIRDFDQTHYSNTGIVPPLDHESVIPEILSNSSFMINPINRRYTDAMPTT
jgi:hypothetical protein